MSGFPINGASLFVLILGGLIVSFIPLRRKR